MIKMKYEEHIYKEVFVDLLTMIYWIKKLVGRCIDLTLIGVKNKKFGWNKS